MSPDSLWDSETELRELGITVPAWIEQDIGCSQVAAIVRGGCESGAYMPAVTYASARETMGEHGDDVVEYLYDAAGLQEWPTQYMGTWSMICTYILSRAVDAWAHAVVMDVADAVDAR